jgi:hypothetical protein
MHPVQSLRPFPAVQSRMLRLSRRQDPVFQTTPDTLVQCKGFSYRHTGGVGPYDFEVVEADSDEVVVRWKQEPVGGNIDWWCDVPAEATVYFNVLQGGEVAYTSPQRTVQASDDISCFFTQPDILTDMWHELYGDTVDALLGETEVVEPVRSSTTPASTSSLATSSTLARPVQRPVDTSKIDRTSTAATLPAPRTSTTPSPRPPQAADEGDDHLASVIGRLMDTNAAPSLGTSFSTRWVRFR